MIIPEHIKNKISIIKITILFLIVAQTTYSQEKEKKDVNKISIIEKRIEMIAEDNEEENIDFSTLFDDLLLYYENPLDLNFAERDQLRSLMLLNEIQINNLLKHIQKNGKLISIYELQAIDGFDMETIRNFLPFVKVSEHFDAPKASLKEMIKYSTGEYFLRETRILEQQGGYMTIPDSSLIIKPDNRFLGSPDLVFTRFRIRYKNNVSIGFTAEKDAGELFFKNNLRNNYPDSIKRILDEKHRNGFDFYSAHFYLKGWGNLKHFMVGDYVLQFGQGLTLWTSRALNKSRDVLNVKKNPVIMRPLTSAGVYSLKDAFMRGAAATYSFFKTIDVTAFYSKNYVDGTLVLNNNVDLGEATGFTGAATGGFHRTPKELSKKNNVGVDLYGGHVGYKKNKLELGVTGAQRNYSIDLQPDFKPYNQFNSEGKVNTVLGADYNYIVRNMNFFGEVSRSQNGGMGQLHGALLAVDPQLSIVALYRNYERNFQPLYANPFRNQISQASNEKGLYLGLVSPLNSQLTFSVYIDKFKQPWLTFYNDAPSQGFDYFGQLTYKPTKKMEFYAFYRIRGKEKGYLLSGYNTKQLLSDTGQTVRLNGSYTITDAVKLQTRVQIARWDYEKNTQPDKQGYIVYQDVIYDPLGSKYSLTLRYCLMETNNILIYTYENDILGAYSVIPYNGRGSRIYLMFQYKILRNLDFWLRISQTYKSNSADSKTISESPEGIINSDELNTIEGPSKTELKAQIRYKF